MFALGIITASKKNALHWDYTPARKRGRVRGTLHGLSAWRAPHPSPLPASGEREHTELADATSPVEPRRLALGDLDRALDVLAAGADVGEHVDQDEIGERRGRLFAHRSLPAGGARAFRRLTKDRVLGIGRPDRVLVIRIERVGQIPDRRLQ